MHVVGVGHVAPAQHQGAAVGEQEFVVQEFGEVVPVLLRLGVVLARQRQVAVDRVEHRVHLLAEGLADEGQLYLGGQALGAADVARLEDTARRAP